MCPLLFIKIHTLVDYSDRDFSHPWEVSFFIYFKGADSNETINKGEDFMENILRNAVEQRRKTLINILLTFKIFDSEEQLLKLSLTELENEYKRLKSNCHPHSDTGSIHWKNKIWTYGGQWHSLFAYLLTFNKFVNIVCLFVKLSQLFAKHSKSLVFQ